MLEGLTINHQAIERTVRLVTTARLRDSVLRDLVDESELDALSEIEGATSNRRIAQVRGAGEVPSNELIYGIPHAHIAVCQMCRDTPREQRELHQLLGHINDAIVIGGRLHPFSTTASTWPR